MIGVLHFRLKEAGFVIDADSYISRLIVLLQSKFGSRLLYVGLQGSYLRGEADDNSDIDVMVVVDNLSVPDLDCYRDIIGSLEEPDKSCGFICGKTDMANWNPLEIFHVLNGTKDYFGVLSELVPAYSEADIRNFVKISLNNLFHEICHRYVHTDQNANAAGLPGSYKSVFFILQNLYYLESRKYIRTKAELLPLLSGQNHAVLERAVELKNGIAHDFSDSFELLFTWCQDTLKTL